MRVCSVFHWHLTLPVVRLIQEIDDVRQDACVVEGAAGIVLEFLGDPLNARPRRGAETAVVAIVVT